MIYSAAFANYSAIFLTMLYGNKNTFPLDNKSFVVLSALYFASVTQSHIRGQPSMYYQRQQRSINARYPQKVRSAYHRLFGVPQLVTILHDDLTYRKLYGILVDHMR